MKTPRYGVALILVKYLSVMLIAYTIVLSAVNPPALTPVLASIILFIALSRKLRDIQGKLDKPSKLAKLGIIRSRSKH
jgi:hypothetical protein